MTEPINPATPDHPLPPKKASRLMAKTIRILSCFLAGIGWVLSVELAKLSSGGASSLIWIQQSCGGDATSGCASVLHSGYSIAQLGPQVRIPVSILGMAYFAMVFCWYLFAGVPTYARRWRHLPILVLVGIGAYQSYYYMDLMANVIGTWCPVCVTTHIVNGGLLLLTLAAFPMRRSRRHVVDRPGTGLWLATLTLCFAVGLLQLNRGAISILQGSNKVMEKKLREIIEDPAYVCWQYREGPQVALPPRANAFTVGPENALHEIVVFNDFQCPACRNAHTMLETVREKYADLVRITYRNLPLNSECNPGSTTRGHPAACQAALAFEAANQLGDARATQRYQRLLFGRQEMLNTADWTKWAEETGLDGKAFAAALNDPAPQAALETDVELMQQLKHNAPPVIFLNGRVVKYWTSAAAWDQLLGSADPNDIVTNP